MRPLGVTLISIFMLLSGLLYFISSFAMIALKNEILEILKEGTFLEEEIAKVFPISEVENIYDFVEKMYDLMILILFVIGLVYLLSSYGLFTVKNWGRILTILLCGLEVLFCATFIIFNPFLIFELIVSVLIIWYLMKKDVKEIFIKKLSIEDRILGKS